jgi:predicted GNAT family N-acyltransferase
MTKLPAHPGEIATSIQVRKIRETDDLEIAKKIRYEVFVIGQNVPAEEEIDDYEDASFHFLATLNGSPAGAARWRFTENGIKLERFAVLEKYRHKGVGSALVEEVLKDIEAHPDSKGKKQYLHAQLSAMRLYSRYGFRQVGSMFRECDIDHYKMIK